MKAKVSKWNNPPDGKTRVVFDMPDSLLARLRAIAKRNGHKTMTDFYNATLAALVRKAS